ncbi:MAG TPA: MFS transporter [Beijerinckiaceae bacterium]|jgi:MFS family permease|nr:MFS transporter [Beijerinckiaceae bacterium]
MANAELDAHHQGAQAIVVPPKSLSDDLIDSRRGWLVVAAAFVGLFFSMGVLVVYSYGVLGSAMAKDLGFNATQISSIFMVFSLTVVVAGPIWGVLTDRFGGRSITIVSSMLLAISFCLMSVIPGNALDIYIAFAAMGVLGSGTLPASYATIVVGWFNRRRGLALGLTMMGVGAGAAAMPPLSAALLSNLGWRNTFLIFGIAIAFFCVPLMMAALKPNPAAAADRGPANAVPRFDLIKSAAAVRTTWVLAFFAFMMGAILIASITNFVPMLQAQGMTVAQAAAYQSILGVALVAGRIIVGGLIDHIFAPRVMLAVLCVTAVGFLSMYFANSPIAYALSAFGIGLAIGAEMDFLAFLVSRYFARAAFATLFAFLFALHTLGASFGPFAIGWAAATFGSYQPGLLVLCALSVILALSTLLLPRYKEA